MRWHGRPRWACSAGAPRRPSRRRAGDPGRTASSRCSRWYLGSPARPWTGSWRPFLAAGCRSCFRRGSTGRPRTRTGRAGIAARVVAVLVDPQERDWELVADLSIPAILVHSKPFDSPELASALATGASALVAADRIEAHFLSVLRMVSQGYMVVDSMPMRPLIEAAGVRWDEPGRGGLPELTSRESDILSSLARGHSIRQTARELGIAPKTVENVQTRLFRKLGVRNRAGALAVADAFGLLPVSTEPAPV